MPRVLAVLMALALLPGCYTNIARVTQTLDPGVTGGEKLFITFENESALPLDAGTLLRSKLQSKGYQIVPVAEGADLQLKVVVSEASWDAVAGEGGGGGRIGVGGAFHGGGGGGGADDLAIALVVVVVLTAAVLAVKASEPKEWLTGTVDLALLRGTDPLPESGSIDLRFSNVSDRDGTYASARNEVVDRILEMF